MIISGKTRFGFYFNDVFLGLKLSRKIKRLMLRIDPLSKKSKFLLGKAEDKNQGEGAEHKATTMSFEITSGEPGIRRLNLQMSSIYEQVEQVENRTSCIEDLLRLHKQILNVSTECEGSLSREANVISETNTIISFLLERTDFVLSQSFLLHPFAIREVEQVRQGIRCIYDILKDMEAVGDGDLDEREKVWMEWVSEICRPANYYIASFANKREQEIKSWAKLKAPAFLSEDLVLRKKMKMIRSRIQFAYGRRWLYGMGGSITDLRPSTGFDLESIWKDVRLMRALSEDVSMEDQCQRVEVWLKQIEELALKVTALNTRLQRSQEKMKARPLLMVKEFMVLAPIEMKVKEISSEFLVMSERKRTYDIGKLEGKRGQSSRVQDLQGTMASTSYSIGEDDDNNLEEAQPGSLQQHKKARKYVNKIEEISSEIQSSTVQDPPGTMASTSEVIFNDVEPGSLQQNTNTKGYKDEIEEEDESIKAESSQMNELINTKPFEAFLMRAFLKVPVGGFYAKEQVVSIESELNLIKALLKDIKAIKEPDAKLKLWEKEMRDIADKAETIVGNYKSMGARVDEKNIFTRLSSIIKNQKGYSEVVQEISIIKKKIQTITERRIAYGIEHLEASNSMTQRRYQRRPPSQFSEESAIIGFEDHVYEIKERLLTVDEPRRCIIAIVGMGGSGKTHLAESIFKDNAFKDNAFNTHAWVTISEKHGAEEILQDIRRQVIVSDQKLEGKQSLQDEPKQMLQIFLRERKYLIVLDNIPRSGVWDDVKGAFPDVSNGSRIVITTRDMAEVPPELKDVGRKIVMRCGGLPLEIENIGKLVSKKVANCEEWTRVLKELEEDKEDKGPWSEISEKVSRELPIELKRCLDYFLLFPEEFEIPARRLITLWVAEGFLRPRRGDDSPEQFAEKYLMELIDRNMVQVTEKKPNGKARSCCLPVALRKHLSKALEDKVFKEQVNRASKSSSSLQQNRWIVDHYNNIDPSNTSFNHIHGDNSDNATLQASYRKSLSFMSFDYREGSQPGDEIGNFLQRCISCRCFLLLRVLDLEHVFRPQLPKVLSKLVLLRYLGLRWTYLESLPSSISNLLKLQTLDVKHTYISSLPPYIWKMKQLRHLYLSESYRSRFGPQPRGASLENLQTLWGAFVDEKSPVRDGLDTLINLKKLGVACRCMSNQKDAMSLQLKAVAEWIQKLKHLQSLRLKSHDENNQPWDLHIKPLSGHTNLSSVYLLGRLETPSIISAFPENLIELTLSASALIEDPLKKLGKLPKLRILRLFSKSYVEKNMCCPQSSFPQLRVLKLWKLEELEDWIVEEGALSRLRDLEIRSCAKLHKLPDGLQHVKTLQELKLSNMPMKFTEQIKDCNSKDWGKIAHVRHVSIEP
ncbi:hypothetical protein ACJW31_04G026400 [Castanea mollissima]